MLLWGVAVSPGQGSEPPGMMTRWAKVITPPACWMERTALQKTWLSAEGVGREQICLKFPTWPSLLSEQCEHHKARCFYPTVAVEREGNSRSYIRLMKVLLRAAFYIFLIARRSWENANWTTCLPGTMHIRTSSHSSTQPNERQE